MIMPASDPRDLAMRLRPDVDSVPIVVNSTVPNVEIGEQQNFWVLNVNTVETRQISATLIHKTDVAYAWVEADKPYDHDLIVETADRFSTHSYPLEVAFFGGEWNPGIDNDPRLHILHATGTGAAGYFSATDEYSSVINPYSNQKEIFYANLHALHSPSEAGSLLAHEFQHMMHWYHDGNEDTWVDEGSSMLAAEIAGFDAQADEINAFTNHPDTQLNAWPEGTSSHYGAAYLFLKYLYQRFGSELLKDVMAQPADGAAGIQRALDLRGIPLSFDDLFADWVIANYANQPDALDQEGVYGYQDLSFSKPTAKLIDLGKPVAPYSATVNNYATDYVRFRAEGESNIHFTGQTVAQLTTTPAYSGRYVWWSNRGDRSDSKLTRLFDLRAVAQGTAVSMEVAMWWEIEPHYDYGYVLASRDGQKWEILPGQSTTTDNPSGISFGAAYTGESGAADNPQGRWVLERFDLSAYAGEQLWVRLEYVTDDGTNLIGWFVDDIRIAAIDYRSDFEHGADGWQSEGWILSDNQLPQHWLLQVMEFDGDTLTRLRQVVTDASGRAQIDIANLGESSASVLAISALTPRITEPGNYGLQMGQVQAEE